MSVEKIIYYIDDDEASAYSMHELLEGFSKKGYEVEFLHLKGTEEEFLSELEIKNGVGIILDYELSGSGIYADATELWKKIKRQNPTYPLCIYTSHIDDVRINQDVERSFPKDDRVAFDTIADMLEYMDSQIQQGLQNINTLERVNKGLKTDDSFSIEVMNNEIDIENQFSISQKSRVESDNNTKLNELIEKAYCIIDNYTDKI